MPFNAEAFCIDYNIPYKTQGKNCALGWVQINCVFHTPADQGTHLGFNLALDYCNCWKCGWHSLTDTITEVAHVNKFEARQIIKKYTQKSIVKKEHKKQIISTVQLPYGTTKLKQKHKDYLIKRNFNSDYLENVFDLKGTSHLGKYKFRIIAPVYLNGQLISYQGRDITGKAELRYKACPKNLESLHHKYSLYGVDLVPNRKAVMVEGITDTWRLGKGAVSTFGTSWTIEQVQMSVNKFNTVFILFDAEDAAQMRAEKLAWNLSTLGMKNVEIVSGINSDPGDLTQQEAKYIMNELNLN